MAFVVLPVLFLLFGVVVFLAICEVYAYFYERRYKTK